MSAPFELFAVDRKLLPLGDRAAFAERAGRVERELSTTPRDGVLDAVVINTCERFEVFGVLPSVRARQLSGELVAPRHAVRALEGDSALLHLFRVASGLDSRLPGEQHVLGQVRSALNHAMHQGTIVPPLRDAFSYAIRCGKRVRQRTALGEQASNYVERTIATLRGQFSTLRGRGIAIVGTGSLAFDVAVALRNAGADSLVFVGRHEGRTATLAQTVGARALSLHQLASGTVSFDVVVAATSVSQPIITTGLAQRLGTPLYIDLGSAPNVDLDVDRLPGIQVARLDDLSVGAMHSDAVRDAEALVQAEVARFISTRGERGTLRDPARRAS